LEKFLIIIAGAVAEHFFAGYNLFNYSLILVGSVSYLTSIQRLFYARKILSERKDAK
jgi:hypothetical protein